VLEAEVQAEDLDRPIVKASLLKRALRSFDDPHVCCHRPEIPVGGRLKVFQEFWDGLVPNRFIRDIVGWGHTIPFLASPPQFRGVKFTPLKGEFASVLEQEVQNLVAKDAIMEVPKQLWHQGFFCHYFLVQKKDGGLRPVLNLRPLNRTVKVESFKMESLNNVIRATAPHEWLASIDLKDAYLHVPMHPRHWKFLRFAIQGKVYQFKVLPFGLSTAPRIFTKVLAPVMASLRMRGIKIHPYLDDILIRADSKETLAAHVQTVSDILMQAGFIINIKKSHMQPSQQLEFLGVVFDTAQDRVYLPRRKITNITILIRSFRVGAYVQAKLWLRLLGLLASTFQVVRWARIKARPLQFYVNSKWNSMMPLEQPILVTRHVWNHLQWWLKEDNLSPGIPLSLQAYQHVVTTDASGDGWGGTLDEDIRVQGVWDDQTKRWHINRLEFQAVMLTLQHFKEQVKGKTILVRSDNATVCAYINKAGGTRSWDLCLQAWNMLHWAMDNGVWLRAVFIPGATNILADALSRFKQATQDSMGVDHKEWTINTEVLAAVFLNWGEPQVDLFASQYNKKLRMYCSLTKDKAAMAQDALSIPWKNLWAYAFPPFALITRVLRKIREEQARVILIAPAWPQRSWYADLLGMCTQCPILLPKMKDILTQMGRNHPNPDMLRLAAWMISGKNSETKEFLDRLSILSYKQGLPAQGKSTVHSGESLQAGLIRGIKIPFIQL
jgi:hypothetical protein